MNYLDILPEIYHRKIQSFIADLNVINFNDFKIGNHSGLRFYTAFGTLEIFGPKNRIFIEGIINDIPLLNIQGSQVWKEIEVHKDILYYYYNSVLNTLPVHEFVNKETLFSLSTTLSDEIICALFYLYYLNQKKPGHYTLHLDEIDRQ